MAKPTARPKYYEYTEAALTTLLPSPTAAIPPAIGFVPGTETPIASLMLDHIKQNDRQFLMLTVDYTLSTTVTIAALGGLTLPTSAQVIFRIYRDATVIGGTVVSGTLVGSFTDTINGGFALTAAAAGATFTVPTAGTTTITVTDDNAMPPVGQKEGSHNYIATAQVLSFGLLTVTLPVVGIVTVGAQTVSIDGPLHFGGMVIDENEYE
jgi:hypothetical protein